MSRLRRAEVFNREITLRVGTPAFVRFFRRAEQLHGFRFRSVGTELFLPQMIFKHYRPVSSAKCIQSSRIRRMLSGFATAISLVSAAGNYDYGSHPCDKRILVAFRLLSSVLGVCCNPMSRNDLRRQFYLLT
jgi:hypothetical protein